MDILAWADTVEANISGQMDGATADDAKALVKELSKRSWRPVSIKNTNSSTAVVRLVLDTMSADITIKDTPSVDVKVHG